MRIEVFDETMHELLKRTPFRPFTISLTNGKEFEVDHRDAVNYRDGTAVYIKPGGIPVLFDHEVVSEITRDLKPHRDE